MCVLNRKSCMLQSFKKRSAQRTLNELQVFEQNKNGRFWTPESPRNLKLTSEKYLEVEYFHCAYLLSVCCRNQVATHRQCSGVANQPTNTFRKPRVSFFIRNRESELIPRASKRYPCSSVQGKKNTRHLFVTQNNSERAG